MYPLKLSTCVLWLGLRVFAFLDPDALMSDTSTPAHCEYFLDASTSMDSSQEKLQGLESSPGNQILPPVKKPPLNPVKYSTTTQTQKKDTHQDLAYKWKLELGLLTDREIQDQKMHPKNSFKLPSDQVGLRKTKVQAYSLSKLKYKELFPKDLHSTEKSLNQNSSGFKRETCSLTDMGKTSKETEPFRIKERKRTHDVELLSVSKKPRPTKLIVSYNGVRCIDNISSEQFETGQSHKTPIASNKQAFEVKNELRKYRRKDGRDRFMKYRYFVASKGKKLITKIDQDGKKMKEFIKSIEKITHEIHQKIYPISISDECGNITKWKSEHLLFPIFFAKVIWVKKIFEKSGRTMSISIETNLLTSAMEVYKNWLSGEVGKAHEALKLYPKIQKGASLLKGTGTQRPSNRLIGKLLHLELDCHEQFFGSITWEIWSKWIPVADMAWLKTKYGRVENLKALFNDEVILKHREVNNFQSFRKKFREKVCY
ncbi:hypothetical protein CROQUDRAFT_712877 [Cronartium quercuum f. sp. fusiforme G11]|uniref:Uncharacterized protein n=1 Tax=Cronartium quercuum f. sp. fusiforme G11 TaxID=708437 RepID=A0A9P6NSY9_9BASI|nr:hypothetical protein CROQUDRAFT_712877 [Cronartium quercuum f. sp. fusiforme G11]